MQKSPFQSLFKIIGAGFTLVLIFVLGCYDSLLPKSSVSDQTSASYGGVESSLSLADSREPTSELYFEAPRAGEEGEGTPQSYRARTAIPVAGLTEVIPSRKIIQNHHLDVAVKDLDMAEERLLAMVAASGGYISRSDMGKNPGARRQGSWTLRVPGTKASDIARGILDLGEPIKQSSDAKDVSEEFYDLEARIKNKKIEEDRLILHLKDSTGKLVDILACEKEITRVRGEIEQAQGRINMLANLTSLATIQVTLIEHKDYKPEAAPTFLTKLKRTFDGSLERLLEAGQRFVLGVVDWAPWVVVWGVILLGLRFLWKVWKSRKPKGI